MTTPINPSDDNNTKSKDYQSKSDDMERLISDRLDVALNKTTSDDAVVHIAWLAKGIDLWHLSDGSRGHNPNKAMHYIISSVTRLVSEECQKERESIFSRLTEDDDGKITIWQMKQDEHGEVYDFPISLDDLESELASKRQQPNKGGES